MEMKKVVFFAVCVFAVVMNSSCVGGLLAEENEDLVGIDSIPCSKYYASYKIVQKVSYRMSDAPHIKPLPTDSSDYKGYDNNWDEELEIMK